MALGQLKLYPATSPQAQKALVPAHALIAMYPGAAGKIVLARTLRGFLVNSRRLPASDATALVEASCFRRSRTLTSTRSSSRRRSRSTS
jgi:hypothetical protein